MGAAGPKWAWLLIILTAMLIIPNCNTAIIVCFLVLLTVLPYFIHYNYLIHCHSFVHLIQATRLIEARIKHIDIKMLLNSILLHIIYESEYRPAVGLYFAMEMFK